MRRPGVALIVLVALGAAGARAEPARACDCAPQSPRESLQDASAAVYGTVLGVRELPAGPASPALREYRFAVEEVFRGRPRRVLTLRSTAGDGDTCALRLAPGQKAGLLLGRGADPAAVGLCSLITRADLVRATSLAPRALGAGRLAVVVAGAFGDGASLVGLDEQGRVLTYGAGGGGGALSACPGSRYLLQAGDDLILRRTEDLAVVGRRSFVGNASAVRCLSPDGGDAVVLTGAPRRGPDRLLRLRGQRRRVLRRGASAAYALGPAAAVLATGAGARGFLEVVSYDGRRRRLAGWAPRSGGSLVLSPDGARAAIVSSAPDGRTRLEVTDLRTGERRERTLAELYAPGDPLWRTDDELLFLGTGPTGIRRFDPELRSQGRFAAWGARLSGAAGGELWSVDWDGQVVRVASLREPAQALRVLPTTAVGSVLVLAREIVVRDAPRRRPRARGAAARACPPSAPNRLTKSSANS